VQVHQLLQLREFFRTGGEGEGKSFSEILGVLMGDLGVGSWERETGKKDGRKQDSKVVGRGKYSRKSSL